MSKIKELFVANPLNQEAIDNFALELNRQARDNIYRNTGKTDFGNDELNVEYVTY